MVGVNSVMASYGNGDVPAGLSFAVSSDYVRDKLAELRPRRHAYFGGWKNEHKCHNQFQHLVRKKRGTLGAERGGEDHMGHAETMHDESDKKAADDHSQDKMNEETPSK